MYIIVNINHVPVFYSKSPITASTDLIFFNKTELSKLMFVWLQQCLLLIQRVESIKLRKIQLFFF